MNTQTNNTSTWEIDPTHSNANFSVRHMMMVT